jgi:hypothetical protein
MNTELNRSLAAQVVAARSTIAAAEKVHAVAAEKVEQIAVRVAETRRRREEITHARLSGKSKPAEAAEQAALGEDLVALQRLHGAAEAEADAHQPAVDAAQRALAGAEDQWQRHQDEAVHAALLARTREHEAALVAAIRATAAAGKALGHRHARASWSPTKELERAMQGAL